MAKPASFWILSNCKCHQNNASMSKDRKNSTVEPAEYPQTKSSSGGNKGPPARLQGIHRFLGSIEYVFVLVMKSFLFRFRLRLKGLSGSHIRSHVGWPLAFLAKDDYIIRVGFVACNLRHSCKFVNIQNSTLDGTWKIYGKLDWYDIHWDQLLCIVFVFRFSYYSNTFPQFDVIV